MDEAADWRNEILKEFTPKVARLTLAADPDGLLLEETLLSAVSSRGFEIITLEDTISFRYAFESRFRAHWDLCVVTDHEVVLRVQDRELKTLPFDLLQTGRHVSFGLATLFPDLSYPVVASLDRSDLDALFRAWARHGSGGLGPDATKDFALLHVFGIAPRLICSAADLLRALLRLHYRGQHVPSLLDDRLVQTLQHSGTFESWPLESIVTDRNAFCAFLQERWPHFLDRISGNTQQSLQIPGLELGGPANLPFDNSDVRVYIDNLFLEGMLTPVCHKAADSLCNKWVAVGIRTDPEADKLRRIQGLIETSWNTIPKPEARHRDWSAFAYRWAELRVLWSETPALPRPEMGRRMAELRSEVDLHFSAWIDQRYAGLHNQPPEPPVMVHHLPRFLSRRISDSDKSKVALVVIDGLALDQWIVLRNTLAAQRPRFCFSEGSAFAWVPTITSVSRQAIFSGMPPFYFASTILATDSEPSMWTNFWTKYGLTKREVSFAKGLGASHRDNVREIVSMDGIRALGLVIDTVDKIMHGMKLGAAGMHSQVRQWTETGFVGGLLDTLFDAGYIVLLTSDHGNIEADGYGRPSEGAVADIRGERARIYPDPILRSRVLRQFPDAIAWPTVGLPEDCLALLAPGRSAFVRRGNRIVGHGGSTLEEVVVPMIEVERLAK